MSAPYIRLVDHGRPRRLSGAEIQALTRDRVAAWRARREEQLAASTSGATSHEEESSRPMRTAGPASSRLVVPLAVVAGPCVGLAVWWWAGASLEARLLALAGAALVAASATIVSWIRLGDREDDGEILPRRRP